MLRYSAGRELFWIIIAKCIEMQLFIVFEKLANYVEILEVALNKIGGLPNCSEHWKEETSHQTT